ncbi:cysteine synthase family protein [Fulvivirgaceae bacterium BMA12]|uniref:Cysteine synthase family protein n=1 Tax=Agaribacillus aureus TaxID=3051825 RepID=A0ABT8LC02_9BACT|nr:cysteine synthase family protein [Fulvivirgaceae bacterium BMA12]
MITEIADTQLKHRIAQVGQLIGNTPLFPIQRVYQNPKVKILAKLEWQQLGSSVKARPAFNIIKDAIDKGKLNSEKSLLDATSGNTGIAYAAVAAAAGINVSLCLPENASRERKTMLKSYGVNIIYTSPFDGTDGAQLEAKSLVEKDPLKYYYADQYANDNNWLAHYHSTGPEIFQQTDGEVTHFVAGLGTTGTFRGTTTRLRELNPDIKAVALHPDSAMHGLEGWKHMETAIVPKIYNDQLADENLLIDSMEAINLIKDIARLEGLLVSPSAAANLLGAIKVANSIDEGTVVTVFPDDASKYSEVIERLFK